MCIILIIQGEPERAPNTQETGSGYIYTTKNIFQSDNLYIYTTKNIFQNDNFLIIIVSVIT